MLTPLKTEQVKASSDELQTKWHMCTEDMREPVYFENVLTVHNYPHSSQQSPSVPDYHVWKLNIFEIIITKKERKNEKGRPRKH